MHYNISHEGCMIRTGQTSVPIRTHPYSPRRVFPSGISKLIELVIAAANIADAVIAGIFRDCGCGCAGDFKRYGI